MWSDEIQQAGSRVQRRRMVAAFVLGAGAGASVVAIALGVLVPEAALLPAAAALAAVWLLVTSPNRLLKPASRAVIETPVAEAAEARETRLGFFGRFRVTPRILLIERLFTTTTARIESLAWVYGVRDPNRSWIPFARDGTLVLKFGDGTEIALPCFHRQVVPCLSALRHYAGHIALGWDEALASSWEADRAGFVASVQSRLGRISGADGTV